VRAFGRFWWDFLIGEDWRIAAGVVVTLGLGALALRAGLCSDSLLAVLVAAGIVSVAVVSVAGAGYRSANRPEEHR
jgi:high-affinity Fe2+/Pb2+ permease